MVNRNVDSINMPKWVASAILIAMLAFIAQSWWARSAEHDTLIEIRTELRLAKEEKNKDDAATKAWQGDRQAWEGVMNGNLKEIKGMLTQAQIDALNKKSN